MDWKLFLTTFGTVFLAELGDKTQLATLAIAGGSTSKWSVFAGSALALVATSAVAVLTADVLSRTVSPQLLSRASGLLLLALGVWLLVAPNSNG